MRAVDERRLRVGVLGCGPIAQSAHLESAVKARNVELYAICDVAEDLVARMAAIHLPRKTFTSYEAMLADPELDAVIVATSDAFHVSASMTALAAGKHVLCEKPFATSVEDAETLAATVARSGLVLQIGHMKRFDAGLQSARRFIESGLGDLLAFKAWYGDGTQRRAATVALQPVIVKSVRARRPDTDPQQNMERYILLAHGSHLFDTARYLAGPIISVEARLRKRFDAHCWFIDVAFASGALGHLDLTIRVRGDWHEGFQVYGENGSISARIHNPWLFKSSEVDIFSEMTGTTTRVLGPDGQLYRRQLEAFADTILNGAPMSGAGAEDGVACVRTMSAIAQSVRSGRVVALAEATEPV